ncbi:hypothetical protein U1Q18_035910 [Sarracenia purpurea var. burkii]
MDDIGGEYVDTGVYGDELRLFGVFLGIEVRFGDFAVGAKLPLGGVRHGQGVRVVFRRLPPLFPLVGRLVHRRIHRPFRIWSSMASHSQTHLLALFPGFPPVLVGWLQHLLVQHRVLRFMHQKLCRQPAARPGLQHQLQRRQRCPIQPHRQLDKLQRRHHLPSPKRTHPAPHLGRSPPPDPPPTTVAPKPPCRHRSPRLHHIPLPQHSSRVHRPLSPPPKLNII